MPVVMLVVVFVTNVLPCRRAGRRISGIAVRLHFDIVCPGGSVDEGPLLRRRFIGRPGRPLCIIFVEPQQHVNAVLHLPGEVLVGYRRDLQMAGVPPSASG